MMFSRRQSGIQEELTMKNNTRSSLLTQDDLRVVEKKVNQDFLLDDSESNAIYGGIAEIAPPARELSPWSPALQAVLDLPPSALPKYLLLGGLTFGLVFSTWAWFGTIEEIGAAKGKLVPQGETYKINPVELGKVTQLAVKEGDAVRTGQTLVELDSELAQKEVERLAQMLSAYKVELSQKQSVLQRLESEARTREAMAKTEILAQKAAIAQTDEKVATTQQLLAQLGPEAIAYQQRQTKLQPLNALAREQLVLLRAEEAAHQERLQRLKPLVQLGAVSKEYVFQAEQALRQTQQQILQNQVQAIPNADEQLFVAGQGVRDRRQRMTQLQGELDEATQEQARLQAELSQKQINERKIKLETQQQVQQLEIDIEQIKAKIAESETLLLSARAQLKERLLTSPVSGTIYSLNLKNTGEVVQAGQTVAEVAPHGVPLVISAVLPNKDAGFIKEGMPVQIKMDAYPYQEYGIIPGTVTQISPDAKSTEQMGEVYRVEVELKRNYIVKDRQKIPFKAGQTATAEIIIRRRRIVDILIDPIRQLQKGGINM
jgi:hemolysin D